MIEEEKLLLNPFPGLRPFRLEENYVFFGRDGQSDEVLTKLRTARFVAVVGASGSGKSSLVSAGLLPALFSGHMPSAGSSWRVATFRPGSNPIRNLAEALSAPEVRGSSNADNRPELLETIERTLRRSSLGLLEVVEQSRLTPGENLLIIADQFEELFRFRKKSTSEHPEDEAAAFVKLLLETKQSGKRDEGKLPIYVILTMRSDYLGDCAHFWGLPEAINEGQFLIPRMTDDNRREAIAGPVIIAGGEITAPLINRLLNDAGDDPAQLPILQHALARTWDYWKERCNAEGPIDIEHYEAVGGMSEALSNHANEAYGQLVSSPELRPVIAKAFKALTEKEADNREGRRPATVGEIAAAASATEEQVKTVVEAFRQEGRSFLMPPPPAVLNTDTLIDISHESLIRGWVLLRRWVDEEAEAARQYVRLAEKAALYPVAEPLLRDPALSNGLRWREENRPTRAWAVRYHPGYDKTIEYLELSKKQRQDELDEKEREHREKVERDLRHAEAMAASERRRVTLRNWGLAILSLLLIAMLGVTIYAVRQKNYAQKQEAEAKKQTQLAANLLKAVEEQRDKAQLAQADAEKQKAIALGERATAQEERKNAERQTIIAKGATAEANRQKQVAVGALDDAKLQATKAKKAELEANVAKERAENQTLRAEELLKTVGEIDLSPAYAKAALRGHKGEVRSVSFNRDASRVVTAARDGLFRLWDAENGGKEIQNFGIGGNVSHVAFSHDGKWFVATSDAHEVNIRDAKSQESYRTFGSGADIAYSSVVFSDDDKLIAAIANVKEVKKNHATKAELGASRDYVDLWNIETKQQYSLTGHSGAINSLAFSKDGKHLVTASVDQTARVWDTTTGKMVAELRGHSQEVNSAEFSPDDTGKFVVTAGKDGTAHVWDAATGEVLVSRTLGPEDQRVIQTSTLTHAGPVTSARFSPDGKFIVTTSGYKAFLWAPESPGQWARTSAASPTVLLGHEDSVTDAVFSPDSTWIVTISQDRTARVWQAQMRSSALQPESVAVFRGHIKPITSVQISRDSKYVVTGSEDKTARVWDLTKVGVFSVTKPVLKAGPAEYTGKCPFTFQFAGTISVAGKGGTVKYKFIRSDNTQSLPQELVFNGPGSKEVSTTWQLSYKITSRAGTPLTFEGWQAIEILEPVAMKSDQADFKLTCDSTGGQQLPTSQLKSDQLAQIMPRAPSDKREAYLLLLQKAMDEFGINTAQRQAQFLAELAHESSELTNAEELASGDAYEGRKDLGNTEPGDGKLFKGRGWIQITGRANYKRYGEQLGVDLIAQPTLAATPGVAFRIAALTWQSNGLNELADKSDTRGIRRRINGGYNGLDEVLLYVKRAREVLGAPTAP